MRLERARVIAYRIYERVFDVGKFKVVWVNYAIMCSISWNLDLTFPEPFKTLEDLFSVLELSLLRLMPMGCLAPFDFISDFYFITFTPLVMGVFVIVVGVARVMHDRDSAERVKQQLAEKGPESIGMFGSGQWTVMEGYAASKLMRAGFRSNNLDPNARHCMASAAIDNTCLSALGASFWSVSPSGDATAPVLASSAPKTTPALPASKRGTCFF